MKLDIGCSTNKRAGFTGIDLRPGDGVDICWDIEFPPWPIEAGTCDEINASHVLEHVKPWKFFDVMDECWRVLKQDRQMTIRTPYGAAYAFDPTHCILFQETSFYYLDPSIELYYIYNPKPWAIMESVRSEPLQEMKTILRKRHLDEQNLYQHARETSALNKE